MDRNYKIGVLSGLGAYFLWGILPIYWKLLHEVPPLEILAGRCMWSLAFVAILIVVMGKLDIFKAEAKEVFSTWKNALTMFAAALAVSINWGIFIWAVENGRIVETSMGYYINPLVSVLFGMVFLGERLNKLQIIAVLWACAGIGVMVVKNGSLPWVSVSLAASFALYGLLKKIIKVQALTSIFLETMFVTPMALAFTYYLSCNGGSSYEKCGWDIIGLLMFSGVVTAVPLLLFTTCAKLVPLYMTGFLQYLSPTLTLLVGVFMYGEAFTLSHALAFSCIWTGIGFFVVSQIRAIK